jgi:hypothetical protein
VVKDSKFSGPASLICRSILDLVFSLSLIMSKPDKYVQVYKKSGWREKYEGFLRDQSANQGITTEGNRLKKYSDFIDVAARTAEITPEEKKDYTGIPYFPTPPQILKKKSQYYADLSDSTKGFLQILMVEFYRPLSQLMHASSPGLAMHIAPTNKKFSTRNKEILLSDTIFTSWGALLSLLAEINIHYAYQHSNKLKELWTYITLTVPMWDEIYAAKYKTSL